MAQSRLCLMRHLFPFGIFSRGEQNVTTDRRLSRDVLYGNGILDKLENLCNIKEKPGSFFSSPTYCKCESDDTGGRE